MSAQPDSAQPSAIAFDDCGGDILVEPACGKIVEKQKRLRALDDDVVDAHRDQIDADRVVDAALDRDLHLGADAVVGGDENRVDESGRFQIEKAAKSAQFRVGAGPARRARHGFDPVDEAIADIDVDAGVGVGQRLSAVGHRGSGARLKTG